MTKIPQSFGRERPDGDDRERRVCGTCGFIDYVNPKIVTGSVALASDGRILLCKRAIEPRRGFWTLPAGFMEEGETVPAAAAREAQEEANANLEIGALIGVYSIVHAAQVHLFFRARLLGAISAGPESLEVGLYAWEEIPWDDLAFMTVRWALEDWRDTRGDLAVVPRVRDLDAGVNRR